MKTLVHNRLRIQRGQALIGMILTTLTLVGVWRDSFPPMHWWIPALIVGGGYIGMSWVVGIIDEKMNMFRYEQERMTQMNPQVNRILEIVEEIDERTRP